MKILAVWLCSTCSLLAADRVPPFGLVLPDEDKAALITGTAKLESEIAKVPVSDPLLPEVKIFHKAVNWAVVHQEFFRSNEVQVAHKLIEQGIGRARALSEKDAPWTQATGLVVRAYVSKIDDSIQPYGLVVP